MSKYWKTILILGVTLSLLLSAFFYISNNASNGSNLNMATPRSSQSVQQIPVPAPAQKESNASELESMKKLKLN